jgi:hypothetical protein
MKIVISLMFFMASINTIFCQNKLTISSNIAFADFKVKSTNLAPFPAETEIKTFLSIYGGYEHFLSKQWKIFSRVGLTKGRYDSQDKGIITIDDIDTLTGISSQNTILKSNASLLFSTISVGTKIAPLKKGNKENLYILTSFTLNYLIHTKTNSFIQSENNPDEIIDFI